MRKRSILAVLLALVLLLSFQAMRAEAATMVDTGKPTSLTLTYAREGEGFAGQQIRLYHVAAISEYADFTLSGAFADLPVEVNAIRTQEEWRQLAQTLSAYVTAGQLLPDRQAETDENGTVFFDALTQGLYLVEAVRIDVEGGFVQFDSFMISLPDLDDADQWVHDVIAKPKSFFQEVLPKEIEYTVNKLWKDEGHAHLRPQSIQLELYCNGELVETVTLSAENGWSYSWTAPDDGSVWQVVEVNVPDGYKVTMEQREAFFFVTNSYDDPPPPPPTGDITNIRLYMLIMCAAGLGLVVLGVTSLRRKKA